MGKRYPRIIGVVGGAGRYGYVRYGGVTAVVGVGAGRGQRNVIGLRAIVDVVVNAGDGHRLGAVPIRRRERHRARIHGCLVGGAAGHRDRHVVGRFAVQLDGERVGGAGLAHLRGTAANVGKRYPRIVAVVGGACGHVDVVQAVIGAVAIHARTARVEDDVIAHRTVVDVIVLTGDGHRLSAVPVAGCERQGARTRRALAGVVTAHRHGDVGGRFAVQFDGERVGAAGLGDAGSTAAVGEGYPRLVVVGGAGGHIDAGQGVVIAVATATRTARVEDDVVGLIAVVHVVVCAGDGHRLIIIPVTGRERQGVRTHRALAGVLAAHRHSDVGGRLGVQFDGERVGAAGLGHLR